MVAYKKSALGTATCGCFMRGFLHGGTAARLHTVVFLLKLSKVRGAVRVVVVWSEIRLKHSLALVHHVLFEFDHC